MLKSLCVKTNNNRAINYLLEKFNTVNLNSLYISTAKFKLYNNFIVHYSGKDLDLFYYTFSDIISSLIIDLYEERILKRIIFSNYFYFTNAEQKKILDICKDYLYNEGLDEAIIRTDSIKLSCIEYFVNNKSAVLDGFINFRIKDYIKIIDYVVDLAVNKFVIDKEYNEFVELLKCYINSKDCNASLVHLIYQNGETILLDEFKNIITVDDTALNSKYLSDISFSSNDYALNTLLTLLPEKIYIHVIDNTQDEFINTIKLIFDDKVYICNDCNLCKLYRLEKIHK